ncbi:unnamed protein product [Closterium sp. Naga37s-1]|nr:unnamed protein product [Closterium sp. Naga37s-1]
MSVPPMSAAAVAAFGGKLLEEPRRRGIEIGGWRIECRHEPILTAEETEAWQAALSTQWLPEMVFGKSCLRAEHLTTGVGVQMGALEALRGWKEAKLPPVKVPAAAAWGKRSRPSTDIILDYDYTFTTPYCGSIITSSSNSLSPKIGTSSTHAPADVSAPLASRVANISISNAGRTGSSNSSEGLAVGVGGGEDGKGARASAEGEEGMREGEMEGAGVAEGVGIDWAMLLRRWAMGNPILFSYVVVLMAGMRIVRTRLARWVLAAENGWVMAAENGWVMAAENGWVMAAENGWVMAAENGWVMAAENGWVMAAENGWVMAAENGWVMAAENGWVMAAENGWVMAAENGWVMAAENGWVMAAENGWVME